MKSVHSSTCRLYTDRFCALACHDTVLFAISSCALRFTSKKFCTDVYIVKIICASITRWAYCLALDKLRPLTINFGGSGTQNRRWFSRHYTADFVCRHTGVLVFFFSSLSFLSSTTGIGRIILPLIRPTFRWSIFLLCGHLWDGRPAYFVCLVDLL